MKAFDFFHGIPKKLHGYDQDAVFLWDENAGDYRMTQVFDSYVKKPPVQGHLLPPADPESKGKVRELCQICEAELPLELEQYSTLDNLNQEALAWLDRSEAMVWFTIQLARYHMKCGAQSAGNC